MKYKYHDFVYLKNDDTIWEVLGYNDIETKLMVRSLNSFHKWVTEKQIVKKIVCEYTIGDYCNVELTGVDKCLWKVIDVSPPLGRSPYSIISLVNRKGDRLRIEENYLIKKDL